MDPVSQPTRQKKIVSIILLLAILSVTLTWLMLTPPGIEGKTRAIGYSVCHQMESHTINLDGRYLPLCARCTGTFLGLLVTISLLLRQGKASGAPRKLKIVVLAIMALPFVVDGVNSTITEITRQPLLYPPTNWLRLVTGLGFGIALGNLIVPLWNQTLWKESKPDAALNKWRTLAVILLLCALVAGAILLDLPFLFYPIAVLSTITIPIVLAMVYSLLWCIILKRENSLQHFRDGIRIFSAGLLTAIFQVGLIDLLRFLSTGSWASLQF